MTEWRVEPATAEDAAGVAEVQTVGWQRGFAGLLPSEFLSARVGKPETWRERLQAPSPYATFVARHTATTGEPADVIGFITVGPASPPAPSGSQVGQLYAIYVRSEAWGTGVGWRLHNVGMDTLRAAGFTEAVLWSLVGNRRTLAFYRRQGWVLTPVRHVEREPGADLETELLRLDLTAEPRQTSQGRAR
ncbi:MAG: N-acetyltransferase family protein [Actinomycetes bacterium]